MTDSLLLSALFDTILPGDATWPKPSTLPMVARLATYPHFAQARLAMLALVPDGFDGWDMDRREAALRAIEASAPGTLADFVTAAYSLYYSDEAVLKVIAATTTYTSRAPQPDGYHLAPFDAAVVGVPARHLPSWRETAETKHG